MRALVATLLFTPLAAHADPISVFAAVLTWSGSAGVASVAATLASYAAVAATVATIGINVYGSAAARRKARNEAARQRAEYNASLEDRSVTTLTANPPWRVIYGRCITGGDIVAIFTSDKAGVRENGDAYTKPDALKHLVIVLAAHQCQAINEVYIDGIPLNALDANGWTQSGEFFTSGRTTRQTRTVAAGGTYNAGSAVTLLGSYVETGSGIDTLWTPANVTLTSGNTVINNGNAFDVDVVFTVNTSTPRVRVSKALGTDSQTVDTYLNSVVPTEWDSSCRLRGITYAVVTLDLEEPRFQGGPPNITFDVSGKLIYDTRTTTTAWSQNPALIIRDFLTSQWGYQCSASDIDTTLCNAAANACDVNISLLVGAGVTANQPKYTINGAFTTLDSREAVLEDLAETMAGFVTYGATWGIVAGVWSPSVMMLLTDDDLDGQIEVVQAGAGMDSIFNGARGQFIASDKATPTDFDSYQNSTFVTADGQALWSDLSLPFCNHKYRARNLARIFVERARQGLVIRYPAKLRAWPLQIGDRVTVTSAEYGFSGKTFRVTDWQFGATTAVQLTLQEDVATVYDLADAASADESPNTNLPNPWVVAAVTGVTCTSNESTMIVSQGQGVIPRVLVQWDAITDAYVVNAGGYVDVYWARPGGQWIRQTVPGEQTSVYITGPAHGEPITVRVSARNSLGAIGNPVYVYHVVSGQLLPAAGSNMFWPALQFSVPGGTYGLVVGLNHANQGYFRYGGVDLGGYGFQPGEVVTLSADLWCDASTAAAGQYSTLYLFPTDSGGNWVNAGGISSASTTPTRKSVTLTLPSAANMRNIGIGLFHQGTDSSTSPTGTVYADRIQVERGPVATSYAPSTALGAISTKQLAGSAATDIVSFYDGIETYTRTAGGYSSGTYQRGDSTFTNNTGEDVVLELSGYVRASAYDVSGTGTPRVSVVTQFKVSSDDTDIAEAGWELFGYREITATAGNDASDDLSFTQTVTLSPAKYVKVEIQWEENPNATATTSYKLDLLSCATRVTAVKR